MPIEATIAFRIVGNYFKYIYFYILPISLSRMETKQVIVSAIPVIQQLYTESGDHIAERLFRPREGVSASKQYTPGS